MMKARRKRKVRREGMTLVEIMIVVVIMAMIAAAVGFSAMGAGNQARIDTAKTEVKSLANIADAYLMQSPSADCPTMDDLQASRLMRKGSSGKDPWGTDYVILCETGDVNVISAGPDRESPTADDISTF